MAVFDSKKHIHTHAHTYIYGHVTHIDHVCLSVDLIRFNDNDDDDRCTRCVHVFFLVSVIAIFHVNQKFQ